MQNKITYRFKVTSKLNNRVLGTGVMTSSKTLDDSEQMQLFHNVNHGLYMNNPEQVYIDIHLEN